MEKVERGQMYYVVQGKNYMIGRGNARPAIIVSEERMNRGADRVMVVYTTTKDMGYEENVPVMVKNTPSFAICGNINTIYKDRLLECIGKVTPEEMENIERGMKIGLGFEPGETAGPSKASDYEAELFRRAEQAEMRAMRAEQYTSVYKELFENLLKKMTGGE